MATKEDVIAALETVVDPELNLDIWNLGLVYNVEVDSSAVNIDLTLTTPMWMLSMVLTKPTLSWSGILHGIWK